jgi:hypothetical protein
MTADPPGHGDGTVEPMKTSSLVSGLAGLLLLTTACTATATTSTGSALSTVLFLGDSIAEGEAAALTAAFAASDVQFQSIAADGGGNVVGPFSDENWKKLPEQITTAKPTVVIYQITTYDWGSEKEQRTAYGKLLTTVTDAGAKLVFVTAPPITPDDFYEPHMSDLARTPSAARATAKDGATVLDASAVWGNTYQQNRNGKADRSTDGIHTCPQGAARFATWLLNELATQFPGFTPANPREWANTGWAADKHFTGC